MYTRDRFYAPIEIGSGQETVVFSDSGGQQLVSIGVGTYWGHNDDTLNATYPGLFKALEDALNASSLAGTYTIVCATPTSSSEQTSSGIMIQCTEAFEIRPENLNFDLDPRLLGFGASPSNFASTEVSASVHRCIMPYTSFAWWDVWSIYKDHAAIDKRSFPSSRLISSDEDSRVAVSAVWDYFGAVRWTRRYNSGMITAPHIFGERGAHSGYAKLAKLALGDINNGFLECVWLRSRQSDGPESTAGDILVQYNDVSTIADVSDYDVACLASNQRQDFRTCIQELQPNGELYQLNLEMLLKTRGYEH